MAKQNENSTLLQASAALAKSKAPADIAGTIVRKATAIYEVVEAENRRIQDEVNQFMGDLKTDIDFSTLDPDMEKATREYLMTDKNEYANLANKIARLDDASSPEYQKTVDRMNEIQRGFTNLAGELQAYNQNKVTTADMLSSGGFSIGTDPAELKKQQLIYGLGGEKAKFSIDKGGKLNFNVNGETVEFSKLKGIPQPQDELVDGILSTQDELSKRGTAITEYEKRNLGFSLDKSFKDPNALASVLSDYKVTAGFEFEDLQEEFFNLRKEGKLTASETARIGNEVKNRIFNAFDEASVKGVEARRRASASATNAAGGNRMSASMQELKAQWDNATKAYAGGKSFTLPTPEGSFMRFADPTINKATGDLVYTKQVFDEDLGMFIEAEAVEYDPKLGRYVKKQSPGKSTKNWTLDEIQAEFGYKF